MATKAQLEAAARYNRTKTKAVTVRFCPGDMRLYEYLRAKGNASGYLKRLLAQDMERAPK